jgi:L-ribulose-5-phosphate 3-epimerase
MDLSRRTVLIGAGVAAASHLSAGSEASPPGKLKVCIFSKHFQWATVAETAQFAKELGFDGVDLTVRSGGHVVPSRVETDLPVAVKTIRDSGLEVPMITTDITKANSEAAAVLRTASQLGIHHYRWGGLTYKPGQSIMGQLEEMKPQVKALAELNRKYEVCGMYHTHSGPGVVGAPIWDLYILFESLDPRWMGANYDIGHATVEGGYGGWIDSSLLMREQMKGFALKDFKWVKNVAGETFQDPFDKSLGVAGQWTPHWCPIGEGMVNFAGFFKIIKANGFSGPVQLHFEYPGLGGAQNGNAKLTVPQEVVLDAMRHDLTAVKGLLSQASLI